MSEDHKIEIPDVFGDALIQVMNAAHAKGELVRENDKGKKVLFGGWPKDIDKKMLIWEHVAKQEPQIKWLYTKNNTLKKENFDQADAYTCALGYMRKENIW